MPSGGPRRCATLATTATTTSLSKVGSPYTTLTPTVDEVQMAMEEIVEKEKDLKQLAQVTNMLFSRNKEVQKQWEE